MDTFRAWTVSTGDDGRGGEAALVDLRPTDLDDLPVELEVVASSLNYKDALALGGRPGVVRRSPLVAGIDVVGEVTASRDDRFAPGDVVTLNGAGLGETLHGGLAAAARVPADPLVAVPRPFSAMQAAAIGTAGLTAALAVLALRDAELGPEDSPVLVTGAGGGAGSLAIVLLAACGWEVHALTGRPDELGAGLRDLGAHEVIARSELEGHGRPLRTSRWGAVVDGVGGQILAGALASLRDGGAAAAYGMAAGAELPTTVMPFILRGVSLLGVNSVTIGADRRAEAWALLAEHLDPARLDAITRTIPLADARDEAARMLEGAGTGRVVVDVRR